MDDQRGRILQRVCEGAIAILLRKAAVLSNCNTHGIWKRADSVSIVYYKG
jgi:hypothetical protein